MRQLVYVILFLALLHKPVQAQDCKEPLCQYILALKEQNKANTEKAYQQLVKIHTLTSQYEALLRSAGRDERKLKKLVTQINAAYESKRKLERDKKELQQQLADKYQELKDLKTLTAFQANLLKQYEQEMADLALKYMAEHANSNALGDEIDQMGFETGYFTNAEAGYKKRGRFCSYKTEKDGQERFMDNRALWRNQLTHIRISGKLYLPVSLEKKGATVPGKLMVYADNQLRETIDYELTCHIKRPFYNYYDIDNKEFALKHNFPEGADLKIAFIQLPVWKTTSAEERREFWISHNKGIFTMTSLKPQDKIEPLTIEKTLEASEIVGAAIRTTSTDIVVRLFDNGTVDNDKADFYFNGTRIISNHVLTESYLQQTLHLTKGINKFSLVPLDTGTEPPCTVTVQVFEGEKKIAELVLHAEIGYSQSIVLLLG